MRPPAKLLWMLPLALCFKSTRDNAIFVGLDAVPMWARGRLYLWLCRRAMARWHPDMR